MTPEREKKFIAQLKADDEFKELFALLEGMERDEIFRHAHDVILPRLRARSGKFDTAIAKAFPRRRGDRSKLAGAAVMEEVALDFAKWRRQRLVRDEGKDWDEAWEQALQETAAEFHVTASTMEDWYRGKSRRRRKKPGS